MPMDRIARLDDRRRFAEVVGRGNYSAALAWAGLDVEARASRSRPACNSGGVQTSRLEQLCCEMSAVHG
jgi:hypothetical protein